MVFGLDILWPKKKKISNFVLLKKKKRIIGLGFVIPMLEPPNDLGENCARQVGLLACCPLNELLSSLDTTLYLYKKG